jgi:predicted phage baseplate assembly protein
MSFGRDVRDPELTMTEAPVAGGLEPRLFPPTRGEIEVAVAARAPAYVPEWTDRRAADAGVALVRAHGKLGATVTQRLNRLPRRLALTQLDVAGVRAYPGTPAEALLGVTIADSASAAVGVAEGTVLVTAAGTAGPALETQHDCTALPGRVATVAVLADGMLVVDQVDDLGGLAPFGKRRRPPAELWWGVATSVMPAGRLCFAVRLAARPGRLTAARSISILAVPAPALRWEAITSGGPVELAVDRDDTYGLTRDGVVAVRADTPAPWTTTTLPGRAGDPPLVWLRARLTTGTFPADTALQSVTLNGVSALARRTIRGEVAEPIERQPSGRSRYRLSQLPVIPNTVQLDIAETSGDPFGVGAETSSSWREIDSLASAHPDDRVFTLDPATGILTFGDGRTGRAVPAGYRNVIARAYATGGGTAGLPRAGDQLSTERSIPGLTGATVLAITTGSDAEPPAALLRRGGASVRSRQRAVAASDYGSLASATPGVSVARAHCLPARDTRLGGATAPGTVTVVVLPNSVGPKTPPMPSSELLAAVADDLGSRTGVLGTTVVAVSPAFREIAVNALLVGGEGVDLALLVSKTRDRIDAWLSPTVGGDGTGWPFGGTVRWDALVRVLVADIPELDAVARLSFRVGGRRLPACTDVPLAPDELVWPGSHILETLRTGGGR